MPSDHVVWQCRSPRTSARATSGGTGPRKEPSRSSGGTHGRPSAAKTPASSAASGSGPSEATHSGEPVARTSAVPNDASDATTSSTGTPSSVTPTSGATRATISGSSANRSRTASPSSDATTTERWVEPSAQRLGSPAGTPPSGLCDLPDDCLRPWQEQRLRRSGCGPDERVEDPRLGLRPDSRRLAQAAGGGSSSELLDARDSERAPDVRDTCCTEPDQPAECGELGGDRPFELSQLRELARLDELAQAALDAGTDAAQLADAAGAHELRNRRRQRADQLGGASVGARRVGIRLGQLEQRRVLVELRGDGAIVEHGGRVGITA